MKTFTYKDTDCKTKTTILKKLQQIQGAFLHVKTDLGSVMPTISTHCGSGYISFDVSIYTKEEKFIRRVDANFYNFSHRDLEENRMMWKEEMKNLINSLNENYAEV